MKTFLKNKTTFAWLGSALLLVTACHDDSEGLDPFIDAYRYTAVVSDRNTFQVDLPDLSGIASIGENPYWFNVKATPDSTRTVTVTVTQEQGEEYRCDSVRVDGVEGDHAFVVIEQAGINSLDDDDNDAISEEFREFIENWENMEEITVQGELRSTPWVATNQTSIPPSISEVKKTDGWEMAFSAIHGKARNTYFGVYNKYLGILRIFQYQDVHVDSGSEWVFKAFMQDAQPSTYHALYNSMIYGIPANHTGVEYAIHFDTSFRLNGANMLTQAVNPYGGQDGRPPRVSLGWTAFDIDMSHYRPSMYANGQVNENIYRGRESLCVLNQSNREETTSLYGNLIMKSSGNLDGSMKMTTTTSNGLNAWSAWEYLTGGAGDFVKGIINGNYFDALIGGGSALYNGAMLWDGQKDDVHETEGTFTGSLTMDTDGTMGLTGINLAANGSTNDLRVGLEEQTGKTKSHLGKGVWSLQEDPVIYVAKDYIAGTAENFSLIGKDGAYGTTSSPRDLALQLIACPDPSSLKVNISPVFKDVKNINVTWNWGVYVGGNYSVNHSKLFRDKVLAIGGTNKQMQLPQLVLDPNHKRFSAYSGGDGKMYYKQIKLPKEQYYHLGNDKYYVWGQQLVSNTVYGERFITAPCLLLPFNEKGGYKIYEPEIPDLVVCVTLSFDFYNDQAEVNGHKGAYQRAILSKRFLPRVETISLKDLKEKMNGSEMKMYMDSTVRVDGVGYPSAYKIMELSYNILNQINL